MKTGLVAVALVIAGLEVHAQAPVPASPCPDEVLAEKVHTWLVSSEKDTFEARPATPSYHGDTGLFHLSSAYTLPKGRFSVALSRDNMDRDPKDLDISFHQAAVAYGLRRWLELGASISLDTRIDADALFQPGTVNDFPHVSQPWLNGLGDVYLNVKGKLMDDYAGDPVAAGARLQLKLPTAKHGLGTGEPSVRLDLLISKNWARNVDFHGSFGFQWNGDPSDEDIGSSLHGGLGINLPSGFWLQMQTEITGSRYLGTGFPQTKPLDLVVGPVAWIKPGFFIRAAVSWNLNFDDRGLTSSWKTFAGRHVSMGFHPGTFRRRVVEPRGPNQPPTVHCRSEYLPDGKVRYRAVAWDRDGDRLEYRWSPRPASELNEARQFVDDASGALASLAVEVTDPRGLTATDTCPMLQPLPLRKDLNRSSCAPVFDWDEAVLSDADKACLDGQLVASPRRALLVGHADAQERHPDALSHERARAVREYLVSRGGRVAWAISHAGAAEPPRSGPARRVEVWLEGGPVDTTGAAVAPDPPPDEPRRVPEDYKRVTEFIRLARRLLGAAVEAPPPPRLVFVPGLGGSKLRKDCRVVWGQGRSSGSALVLRSPTGDGVTAERLDHYAATSEVEHDVYDTALGELTQRSTEPPHVFAYDWRLDIRDSGRRLNELLNRPDFKDRTVLLVGHSLGGVVIWEWQTHHYRPEDGPAVVRTMFLGSPLQGSCEVADLLANGYRPVKGRRWYTKWAAGRFNKTMFGEIGAAAFTFPSGFQILPSDPGCVQLRMSRDAEGNATRADPGERFFWWTAEGDWTDHGRCMVDRAWERLGLSEAEFRSRLQAALETAKGFETEGKLQDRRAPATYFYATNVRDTIESLTLFRQGCQKGTTSVAGDGRVVPASATMGVVVAPADDPPAGMALTRHADAFDVERLGLPHGQIPNGVSFQAYLREELRLLTEADLARRYADALLSNARSLDLFRVALSKGEVPDLRTLAHQVRGFLGRAHSIEALDRETKRQP